MHLTLSENTYHNRFENTASSSSVCKTHWNLGMALRQQQLMESSYFYPERSSFNFREDCWAAHVDTSLVCVFRFVLLLLGWQKASKIKKGRKDAMLECKRLLQGRTPGFSLLSWTLVNFWKRDFIAGILPSTMACILWGRSKPTGKKIVPSAFPALVCHQRVDLSL